MDGHGSSAALSSLPARGKFLIRDAYVMTMDPAIGDLPNGDVHVENGAIAGVGSGLSAPGAQPIDGQGFIVLPGLVDTHWHMWTTLLRSICGDDPARGYFPVTTAIGKVYTPSDMYYGTLMSAAEALHSGITTVHDWCHNILTPEHAEADIRVLQQTGLRARFSYGSSRAMPFTKAINVADLQRLHRGWAGYANEGLLSLGLGWRGVQAVFPTADGKREIRPLSPDVWRTEYDAARAMDIPISVHANQAADKGHIAAMEKLGLLYKDLQVIHALTSTPEEIRALGSAGGSVSISPFSELRIGYGIPKICEFVDRGVTVGLSVDSTPLTGNADMFGIMKVAQNIENGRCGSECRLPARRVLEMGTSDGARSLGLSDRIGSLTKGKRADLIMVNARDVNMAPVIAPAHSLVEAAQSANVDTVIVDGRILKRRGKLTAIDVPRLVNEVSAASSTVRTRANWM
ncbi:MAG: amidohydrolase family protein [Candidatus Acidiferrales bacterium]|jgi:cytosine/adenosine deaminase-related metal-dependent hydrolase